MKGIHIQTPLIFSDLYSEQLGVNVYLKMENLQPAGSFKTRGIGYLCSHYVHDLGKTKLIASSGGNAGIAVAYCAKKLNVTANIYVPKSTPKAPINKMEALGANVFIVGDVWDDTDTHARKASEGDECGYISPFDHPVIWQGHSTIIDELNNQLGRAPDAIACSVGGGGLLCGLLLGLEAIGWDETAVLASETEGANSFYRTFHEHKIVKLEEVKTIAKTLGAKYVTSELLNHIDLHKIESLLVTDDQALEACCNFARENNILVEPACGAALALCSHHADKLKNYDSLVIIVCGGSGTDIVIDELRKK